jgi:ankyrin repeat protein
MSMMAKGSQVNGHTHVVRLLLENGATSNGYDTALWYAFETRRRERVVQLLLQNGADVNIL